MMSILAVFAPGNEELENKHGCTTYIKYQEHYQITPMTWYYRDSFKCIECGKDDEIFRINHCPMCGRKLGE